CEAGVHEKSGKTPLSQSLSWYPGECAPARTAGCATRLLLWSDGNRHGRGERRRAACSDRGLDCVVTGERGPRDFDGGAPLVGHGALVGRPFERSADGPSPERIAGFVVEGEVVFLPRGE